jgi:hypothetical protein
MSSSFALGGMGCKLEDRANEISSIAIFAINACAPVSREDPNWVIYIDFGMFASRLVSG